MTNAALTRLFRAYGQALEDGDAALFVGAGLSVPAGFVDWKTLMRDIADELGLSVDRESDLVALAQYHWNEQGNRTVLNRRLIEEFTKDHTITENHLLLAQLPVRKIWTTNYDRLLETAFEQANRRVDRKTTQANLSTTLPKRDVTLYKMHGDIEQPQDAVLTKEDYETYDLKRKLFVTALQGDLVEKTFLFLGFSFTDPNIDYVLGRIRSLLGENPREHFWITKRVFPTKDAGNAAEDEYEVSRQRHRVRDLKRYGITAILVDEYSDVTDILRSLLERLRSRSIFVSGSAHEYGALGPERVSRLASRIGAEIIRRNYRLVSGFGLGVGPAVLMGAVGELYASTRDQLEDRVVLRPFPQNIPADQKPVAYRQHRNSILSQAGFAIFLAGNRLRQDLSPNISEVSAGVLEEFEVGLATGVIPIPIGGTGYAAEQIWASINADPSRYFGEVGVAEPLRTLGDSSRTDDEWIDAIFAIVDAINEKALS